MKQLEELYKQGMSFGRIGEATGLSRGKVQRHLIKAGIHQPKRRVSEGRATCSRCERHLPVSEFPDLMVAGSYRCKSCKCSDLHKYQIEKLGCTEGHYTALLESQNGVCAICGAAEGHKSKDGVSARLAVDHDHETGEIRGLLCMSCNRGLGRFKDSLELLDSAQRYLRKKR